MSILKWPADLTDFRLPPAWDRRPVEWDIEDGIPQKLVDMLHPKAG